MTKGGTWSDTSRHWNWLWWNRIDTTSLDSKVYLPYRQRKYSCYLLTGAVVGIQRSDFAAYRYASTRLFPDGTPKERIQVLIAIWVTGNNRSVLPSWYSRYRWRKAHRVLLPKQKRNNRPRLESKPVFLIFTELIDFCAGPATAIAHLASGV